MIRDILDKLTLVEAKGIANRKPGDAFVDEQGSEIYFQNIKFYPEGGGRLSPEELDALEIDLEKEGPVIWTNSRTAAMSGVGVATFTDDSNLPVRFGRYFQEVKGFTTANFWPNAGLPGFKFTSKSSTKLVSGLTPQDILTTQENLTPEQVVEQIEVKFGRDHPLSELAHRVSAGDAFPISIPKLVDIPFVAFRDYFCELLHPIALMRGTAKGNAAEAEDLFLGDGGYADCLISFGTSKTEGLSDSILINSEGRSVKVSSKGGVGAEASVRNLIEAVDELAISGNSRLKNKHSDSIKTVRIVKNAGAKRAPGELAVIYGIISEEEASMVEDLQRLENQGLVNYSTAIHSQYLSKRLKRIYAEREPNSTAEASAFYHMVASIAHLVSARINKDGKFSDAAADILNHAALVQVYTTAKETQSEWVIDRFDAKYPGSATTGVLFSANKNYYSTGIKGNFTFKILRGVKDIPDSDDIEVAAPVVDTEPAKAPDERSDKKASDTAHTPTATDAQLGRARR